MAKGHKRHSFKKGKHFGKRGKGQTKTKTKEWEEKFNQFQEFLKSKGLYMRDVEGDGNCLFRAISDQMIGDESMHEQYRLMAVDYIKSRKEYFAMFLQEGENIDDHITAMSKDGVWGGDFELVALSEVLGVKFCIHTKDQTPFIVKSSEKKKFSRVVHLAYHVGEHYSSVRMLGDDKKEPAMEIQMKLPDDSDEDEIVTEESILKIRSFFLSMRVKIRRMLRRVKGVKIKSLFGIENDRTGRVSKKNDFNFLFYLLFILVFLKVLLNPN